MFYLDLRYYAKHTSGYIFYLFKSKPRRTIKYILFEVNKNTCVCDHINFYLEKSQLWHKTELELLLSPIGSCKGVSVSIISRWIMTIVSSSDIDTDFH